MNMSCGGTATDSKGVFAAPDGWRSLGALPVELQLAFCLPTGQSFRWRQTGLDEYTGAIGTRLVRVRQRPQDVVYRVVARGPGSQEADDHAALRDYFNLDTQLCDLAHGWAASCARFQSVSPYFPGARMLRQDPLECLFQFICSSNNHISRIHGMVERLCSAYGTPLVPMEGAFEEAAELGPEVAAPATPGAGGRGAAGPASPSGQGGEPLKYYAFPTLEQLSEATEDELRAAGFGYRARFIVGTVKALLEKPGGGRQWLLALRDVSLEEAIEALTELPGIGPKVAACICLFSLDKHHAIPVDTHVWQIAVRYYRPQLKGKSLTKKIHAEVQQIFVERFGAYAGWAHNTLFISELASQQHRLPESLRQSKARGRGKKDADEDTASDTDSDAGAEALPTSAAVAPRAGGRGAPKRARRAPAQEPALEASSESTASDAPPALVTPVVSRARKAAAKKPASGDAAGPLAGARKGGSRARGGSGGLLDFGAMGEQ